MVLIITNEEDYYTVDLVQEGLEKRGLKVLRINMDTFPDGFHLTESISNTGRSLHFQKGGKSFDTKEVQGIWLRKYWAPKINPDLEVAYQLGAQRESTEVFDAFLHSFKNIPFIDPWENISRAFNKYWQLEICHDIGIRIPNTLITNSPDELRAFHEAAEGEVVAKLLTPLSVSMTYTDFFMYTTKVSKSDVEDAGMLDSCPMCFQEYIEKEYELRIAYVDGNFFTGKLDATETAFAQTDWRLAGPGEITWANYELPEKVKTDLRDFMNRIGLLFGAIDMIKSKNGEYVFLEVNPTGEWGMMQRDLGLPIADAIATSIAGRINKG